VNSRGNSQWGFLHWAVKNRPFFEHFPPDFGAKTAIIPRFSIIYFINLQEQSFSLADHLNLLKSSFALD
jgi:hypothetical protein